MLRPLRKEGRPVRRNGRPTREGCLSSCCTPPPAEGWLQYVPCEDPSPDPCKGPPLDLEIYVDPDLICAGTSQTLRQIRNQTGVWPVISWAGHCWLQNGATFTLPPGARGPSGPTVQCAQCFVPPHCEPGPRYVFLRHCENGVTLPFVFCLADVAEYIRLGIGCPVLSIAANCYYLDWTNASPHKPANFSIATVGSFGTPFNGCCHCKPEPCTVAIAHTCPVVPGVISGLKVGDDCCANASRGVATITWDNVNNTANGGFVVRAFGAATRFGLNLTGQWRRIQSSNGVVFADETFPISRTFGAGTPFSPNNMLTNEELHVGAGVCPLSGGGGTGTWRSSCRTYTARGTLITEPANPPNGTIASNDINYVCDPRPIDCEAGCPSANPPGGPPTATPPIGPGGGPALLPDFTTFLDALP